jgi:predicted DNA-binding transcriptional regulator AlpA
MACETMYHVKQPLTTVQLARMLGIGRATIYRWLKDGSIRPSIEPKLKQVDSGLVFQPMGWTADDLARIRKWMAENYRHDKAKGGRK